MCHWLRQCVASIKPDPGKATGTPRLGPNSDDPGAPGLARRTLTNLYNERRTWLRLAHQKLDAAVFAAYDWPENLSDDEILEKLLALNLQREPAK